MLLERFPFDLILSHRDAQNDAGPSNPNHQFAHGELATEPEQGKERTGGEQNDPMRENNTIAGQSPKFLLGRRDENSSGIVKGL